MEQNAVAPPVDADPAYVRCNTRGGVAVLINLKIVDRIEADALLAFRSVTSRGSEVGGFLLGSCVDSPQRAVIMDEYAALECEHARGPLYRLSDADYARAAERLARRAGALKVLGFYRSNTRRDFRPDDDDAELLQRTFGAAAAAFVLIRPFSMKPSAGLAFFTEQGALDPGDPGAEFPFQVAALQTRRPELLVAGDDPLLSQIRPAPVIPIRREAAEAASRPKGGSSGVAAPAAETVVSAPQPARPIESVPPPPPKAAAAAAAACSAPALPEPAARVETAAEPVPAPAAPKLSPRPTRLSVPAPVAEATVLVPAPVEPVAAAPVSDPAPAVEAEALRPAQALAVLTERDAKSARRKTRAIAIVASVVVLAGLGVAAVQLMPGLRRSLPGADQPVPAAQPAAAGLAYEAAPTAAPRTEASPVPTAGAPEPAAAQPAAMPTPAEAAAIAAAAPTEAPAAPTPRVLTQLRMPVAQARRATSLEEAPSLDAAQPGGFGTALPTASALTAAPPPAAPSPTPMPPAAAKTASIQPARLMLGPAPEYPLFARQARVTGAVEVDVVIGRDGRVRQATAVSGPQILRSAAAAAVRGWVYQPATLEGRAVETSARVKVTFSGQ